MDTDLVGSARARLELHKGEATEAFGNLVKTDRLLGFGNILVGDDHAHSVGGVVHDPFFDIVAVAVEHALGDHRVFLEHLAGFKQHGQVAVGVFLLGDQDGARGVAVEPVNDAGAVIAIDSRQLREMKTEGIHQGAGPVALGRVHHHVGRLVDDSEEFILIKDFEGDLLGDRFRVGRGRRGEPELVAVADAGAGFAKPTVDHDTTVVDELLGHRAGDVGQQCLQELVEAQMIPADQGHMIDPFILGPGEREREVVIVLRIVVLVGQGLSGGIRGCWGATGFGWLQAACGNHLKRVCDRGVRLQG